MIRRRRLPDGTFGEPEKVFDTETQAETIGRLEAENLAAMDAIATLYEQVLALTPTPTPTTKGGA